MIETSWLAAFASFAEDANLSRAARRLRVSQPAVHAQVRHLAESLGVDLYRRQGRGLVLTPEGLEVAAFARDFQDRARLLQARVRGEDMPDRLALAAGAGALLYVLGEGLRAYTQRGKRRLDILTADAADAIHAVRSGAAHVGVAASDIPPGDLLARTLTHVEQVLVLPKSHPLAKKRRVRLPDLDGLRMVLPPEGRPHRTMLDLAFHTQRVRVEVGAVARGWELTAKLVELGFGLAIVNACCRLPRGTVARPVRDLPGVTYFLFTRPRPRAGILDLVDTLARHGDAWNGRK